MAQIKEEKTILITMRVSHGGRYVVPGSLPHKCSACGEPTWIAPSSWLIMQDKPGSEIMCEECAMPHMVTHPGEISELTPAQRDEIEEYRRR